MAKSNYGIPGSNRVTLGNELVQEIRQRFEDHRENRFQLYLLSSGIRRKYLDKKSGNYTDEFQSWYKKTQFDSFSSISRSSLSMSSSECRFRAITNNPFGL